MVFVPPGPCITGLSPLFSGVPYSDVRLFIKSGFYYRGEKKSPDDKKSKDNYSMNFIQPR